MDDRELRESLRHLPDARAGADFTESVLVRVEACERHRATAGPAGAPWRPALLAAGLLVLVALALGRSDRPTGGPRADSGARRTAVASVAPSVASDRDGVPVDAATPVARPGAALPVPATAGSPSFATEPAAVAAANPVAAPGAEDLPVPPPPPTGGAVTGDPFAAAAERLSRLRAERAGLEARLAAFRRELPPAEPPVVLLGADEGLELVFDLASWSADRPARHTPSLLRPAVHVPAAPSQPEPPRRF